MSASRSTASGGSAYLLSVALSLVLFGLLSSTTRLWQSNGALLIPSGSYTLIPAFVLLAVAILRSRRVGEQLTLTPEGFAIGLGLLFCSDWFDRSYNFFPNPSVRGEILFGALIFLLIPARHRMKIAPWFAVCAAALLLGTFLVESDGRLLFSDDHPSFLLRLALLREEFPRIPFYYPFWNAGLDARDFFATGTLGVFLLFSPILYLTSIPSLLSGPLYDCIVAALLFIVVPLATLGAARVEGLQRTGQAIATVLSLCLGLVWYRWALKYGTMGFVLACALTPLNFSLALSLLDSELRRPWRTTFLFVLSSSLMLCWTPSGLVFIPAILAALLIVIRRMYRGSRPVLARHALLAGALLVALNLPWMSLFWSVSNVGRFLKISPPASEVASYTRDSTQSSGTKELQSPSATTPEPNSSESNQHQGTRHREGGIDIKKSVSLIREKAFSTNPLLLFLTLPGLFLLRRRTAYIMFATGIWLLFLGAILVPVKPQLELDRMLVVLSMLGCIPTGAAAATLLTGPTRSFATKGLVAGLLFVSPLCSSAILSNRTVDQYHFAGPLVAHMAEAIRELGGDGRTVFAGCIVHELEEGHIAPLTLMSGKELVASAPFHTLWRYTQVIPKSFMQRGDEGIEEFFTFMNATSVLAHEREWRDYFYARPDKYQLVWREERFSLFERIGANNQPFLSGEGSVVSRRTDGLVVRVNSESAILKYNFFPFLEALGCDISPAQVAPEFQFIELKNCPKDSDVFIHAGSPWKRLFQ